MSTSPKICSLLDLNKKLFRHDPCSTLHIRDSIKSVWRLPLMWRCRCACHHNSRAKINCTNIINRMETAGREELLYLRTSANMTYIHPHQKLWYEKVIAIVNNKWEKEMKENMWRLKKGNDTANTTSRVIKLRHVFYFRGIYLFDFFKSLTLPNCAQSSLISSSTSRRRRLSISH